MNNLSFFITDMRPNGCRDLVVTKEDGEVVEYIEEAIFGNIPLVEYSCLNEILNCKDGDYVFQIEHDGKPIEDLSFYGVVYQVDQADLKKHVAVNPCCPDGAQELRKYL